MRAIWLTWRIHRFEALFVLALAALLGVSAWVISDQIRALGLGDVACFPRTEDGDYASTACSRIMEAYWGVEGQGALVRVGLTVVPMVLGLIVGVPVVARELELRTAGFAWALTPSRMRWLLARLLPMLLVALAAVGFVAWAGTTLFDAMWLARRGPDLTEIAGQGVALVARGLAGFGVALLVGALVGRTMPAFLIAAVVLGAWGLVAVPGAQEMLVAERSVWQPEGAWREGDRYLRHLDEGYFDTSQPGRPGEPGKRIDEQAVYEGIERQVRDACGQPPGDGDGDSPEYRTWSECANPFWEQEQTLIEGNRWNRVVPRSAWGDFATLDVLMSLALGGTATLLTFGVVLRRRPE